MDCSYYEVLMVTPEASPEVIRAAYKALSQKWHPDRNDHPDAPQIMTLLNQAYEELSDPDRRLAYDAWIAAGCPPDQISKPPKSTAFEVDEEKLREGLAALDAHEKKYPKFGKMMIWALIVSAITS
ncbi:J domain-containing protein [Ralstonia pickettii]|jgi:curved DNA-binding protein CbpA|uniref:J domain-containing protein n=1 Tax=Ralstonia pickettii TaxID=329 RepID=UPI0015F9609E|nr:J domain-containing protein [Ralstonia pickettii]MBB0022943.1 J domain-containing protein [Ralstonia pickettii]MBB0033500.1 J domain-containing protein [Ralstonia pickettii]MBB0095971.1 J domain-containing protein [Ralstonia pickettii]MBB0105968.1 J domain-containing protein [Ralstonia pickettii]MBB0127612.1 J domain-containing protein [Ralstonia pickettii]